MSCFEKDIIIIIYKMLEKEFCLKKIYENKWNFKTD